MAEETKSDRVTLEELVVSTLAMTDALAKLMLAKGVINETEFLSTERELSSRAQANALIRLPMWII